ncbi:MAG: hypothetical protein NTV00_01485 [Methylococcales bacterium]|nr:hypothetical protein [Methylococcales bacterium]
MLMTFADIGFTLPDDTYPTVALILITIGVLVGIVALFLATHLPAWLRLLIVILYLLSVLFSLIAAGL